MIGPATEAGLLLEPSLVKTVLADLGDEPGSLPLVSHALFATWQRRRGRVLAVAGYQQAGGVRQTIAHSAERVLARWPNSAGHRQGCLSAPHGARRRNAGHPPARAAG